MNEQTQAPASSAAGAFSSVAKEDFTRRRVDLRMLKVARELVKEQGVKVLVYGPAGAGKTSLIKTVADPQKAVVIDFEGGVLALADSDVWVASVSPDDDIASIIAEVCGDDKFKVVMFDGLSLFIRSKLLAFMAQSGRQRATFGEWSQVLDEVRKTLYPLLHSKGKLIVFTALSRIEYRTVKEDGQFKSVPVRVRPDLPPAAIHDFVAGMDLAGYLVSPKDPLIPRPEREILFTDQGLPFRLDVKTRKDITSCPADLMQLCAMLDIDLDGLVPKSVFLPKREQRHEQFEPKRQDAPASASKQEYAPQQATEVQPRAERQPEKQPQQASQQPERQPDSKTKQMVREIFQTAEELGLDNRSLGRMAREMFGTGYVRELDEKQLEALLAHLQKLKQPPAEVAQEQEWQQEPPQGSVEELPVKDIPVGQSFLDDFLLQDWQELPHANLLSMLRTVFVGSEWTSDLTAIMIAQAAMDVGLPPEVEPAEALKDERVAQRLVEELTP